MLHTNLSTRPFYNERLVRLLLGAVALVALALTVFNAAQVIRLTSRGAEVRAETEASEREAEQLRAQGRTVQQSLNREQLAIVQSAALEANLLIDRRAFSWTDLFNRFETTLPGNVRIAAVQPQIDSEGRMLVVITAVSRRVEDLDEFIEALEKTGKFRGVLSRQESAQDDGTLLSTVQGYYVSTTTPETQATGSEAPVRPSNQTRAQADTGGPR